MLRLSVLTIPALLFTASPATAASQRVTEQVISFDQPHEAPAIAISGVGEGPQKVTEQIAAFDAPADAPSFAVALAAGEGPQKVTEQIAAFEPVQARRSAAASAAPVRARTPRK